MPFSDDVRKFHFASLDKLTNVKGSEVTKHALLPTDEMMESMGKFVDSMDLTQAGDKTEDGFVSSLHPCPN